MCVIVSMTTTNNKPPQALFTSSLLKLDQYSDETQYEFHPRDTELNKCRLTPGSEVVPDIPKLFTLPPEGGAQGRLSKQLRGISGTAEGNQGVNLFVA